MTSHQLLVLTLTVIVAAACSDPADPALDAGDDAGADASVRDAASIDATITEDASHDDASQEDAASDDDAGSMADGGPSGPSRVFVSSVDFHGNLYGEPGGGPDAICAGLATAAGFEGTWIAWLSTESANAIDRIEGDGPFLDMMGRTIFETRAEITAGVKLTSPTFRYLRIDENGDEQPFGPVWTGNEYEGTWSGLDCGGWHDATDATQGTVGFVGEATAEWNRRAHFDCDERARLYCFEQP